MKNELKKNKSIISIYARQHNTESFLCGWVTDYSDSYVLINSITPKGRYDGYAIIKTDDIYRIDKEGIYEKKIGQLAEINLIEQKYKKVPKISGDLLNDLLDFSQQNQYIISIELCDSGENDIQGIIDNTNENIVEILVIDSFGKEDGKAVIMKEQITSLSCNDDFCKTLLKLYNLNK